MLLVSAFGPDISAAIFSVTNTADAGLGSLRQAIFDANASAGQDVISFSIPGPGPHTIAPTSPLPAIFDSVTIDGSTQPGFAGSPVVVLNGVNAGVATGLTVITDGAVIRSIAVNGFGFYGISIQGDDNAVESCYVATDVSGTIAVPNQREAISVSGNRNRIGTNGDGINDAGEGNLVSGNNHHGISVTGTGNRIAGNRVGTDLSGTVALLNRRSGIIVSGDGNIIGCDGDGIGDTEEGNLVSGNRLVGILLFGNGNVIAANLVGTDLSGSVPLGNGQVGAASGNGVIIFGFGNRVGTNGDGVSDSLEGNVISANNSGGMRIDGDDNTVAGNNIGTSASGVDPIGNLGVGIISFGNRNRFGTDGDGSSDGVEGNVISANNGPGFEVFSRGLQIQGDFNVVSGNIIGSDINGSALMGNAAEGLLIDGDENVIGANGDGVSDDFEGNLVSGNGRSGILVSGTANSIQANLIGTDLGGLSPLGNNLRGIDLSGSNNDFGTVRGNISAFNGAQGLLIRTGVGNTVLNNSIHANGLLGIDLGLDSVTPNDSGDADTGPNDLQNFPVITAASGSTADGTLNSLANSEYTLEFFANAQCDSSGHGEGEVSLGTATASTDNGGNAAFSVAVPAVPSGQFLTATATDPNGSTSEFSACFEVTNSPPVAHCLPVTVATEPGTCSADASIDDGSFDPDGDTVTIEQIPDGPFPKGTTEVTLVVTDPFGAADICQASVTVVDITAPSLAVPPPLVVECDGMSGLPATDPRIVDWLNSAQASDACGVVSLENDVPDTLPTVCASGGETAVTFTALDDSGNRTQATSSIAVFDTTPPQIACNVSDITPSQTPASFTATAADTCSHVVLSVSDISCSVVNGAGTVKDKANSCDVSVDGATVTINDSGGVGTTISWTVTATDACGNTASSVCRVDVRNPGQGQGGQNGNEGVGNGADPDTPGHGANGGNDDPGNGPGNPGARNK